MWRGPTQAIVNYHFTEGGVGVCLAYGHRLQKWAWIPYLGNLTSQSNLAGCQQQSIMNTRADAAAKTYVDCSEGPFHSYSACVVDVATTRSPLSSHSCIYTQYVKTLSRLNLVKGQHQCWRHSAYDCLLKTIQMFACDGIRTYAIGTERLSV